MKNKVILIVSMLILLAGIIALPFFFGNNPSKIEELYNKTITAMDSGNSDEINALFSRKVPLINTDFENEITELNDFYTGPHKSIDELTIYHETDNFYKAYATVTTDNDSYFVCITATGARMIDPVEIKQIIVEKSETFNKKHIFKKKILKDYASQARVFGITIRTPGDHGIHAKENKLMNELAKEIK